MSRVEQIKKELAAKEEELKAELKKDKEKIIEQVKKLVEDYELTPAQCGFRKPRTTKNAGTAKAKAEPKYQIKKVDGTIFTFSGQGRTPKEVEEYLKKTGQTLEKFKADPKNAYVKP